MRYYVVTKGSPDFIWAEFAASVTESAWAEEDPLLHRLGLQALPSMTEDDRIATLDELVATVEGRDALERWRQHDDAAFDEIHAVRRLALELSERRADLRLVR